jgi:DNA-binding CsgD family transcriptional regulator
MTRRPRHSARRYAERATDREVGVVAAVLEAGSEKAAAHRLGLSHSTVKHHLANARSKVGAETTAQLVWILAPPLPGPEGVASGAGKALTMEDLQRRQDTVSGCPD